MADWWEGDPEERYWCEVTDRDDLGADLKCPQVNERGRPYWSYSLIRQVRPGEIVFHYATELRAFIGASVAGGPLEDREIVWSAHGTVGRANQATRLPRPGWWIPLYSFTRSAAPLTLGSLHNPSDESWIRSWIATRRRAGRVAAPLQAYGQQLRGQQAYLTKMPAEWVRRWSALSELAGQLKDAESDLSQIAEAVPPPSDPLASFKPKSDSDYRAIISQRVLIKSRSHETLVASYGTWLAANGFQPSTAEHPKDLVVRGNGKEWLAEVKVLYRGNATNAVREVIGQLFTYRFMYPGNTTDLLAVFSEPVGDAYVALLESLGIASVWASGSGRAWKGSKSAVQSRLVPP